MAAHLGRAELDRLAILQGRQLLKMFLDDMRPAPEGWVLVETPEQAIELIGRGQVEEISLDHDLGLDDMRTGYTVLLWIEEQVSRHNDFVPPKIHLHTMNPVGRIRMQHTIAAIERMLAARVK